MTPEEFRQYWRDHYDGCPPIGYYLREAYPERWFRIHHLPNSKRYAESDNEYEEIFRRHNSLLTDVIGKQGTYILVTTGYSETPNPVRSYPQLALLAGDSTQLFSIPKHELEGDTTPYYWHFFMSNRIWSANSVDDLLRLIADGVVANILFVGVERDSIYHPYDGGADVLVSSESIRERTRQQYAAWLSNRADGM